MGPDILRAAGRLAMTAVQVLGAVIKGGAMTGALLPSDPPPPPRPREYRP